MPVRRITRVPGTANRTRKNGSSWTRSRARIPKLPMLENASTNRAPKTSTKATYGRARMPRMAAQIARRLATVRHSSTVLSSAVTAAWGLWASNRNGRNRMVTVAIGNLVGD